MLGYVFESARKAESSKKQKEAFHLYLFMAQRRSIIDPKGLVIKENSISVLCKNYLKKSNIYEITKLVNDIRPLISMMPKAKAAKFISMVIDQVSKIPDSMCLQLALCKEHATWARMKRRNYLRYRIELRLAKLYFETQEYQQALSLVLSLLLEVKKLDDKVLLVDIYLLESRIYYQMKNLPKAKASLTAARSNANPVYIAQLTLADIDLQSGILCAEEKDYKTAYSYYYEAFSSLPYPRASSCLKFMLLCKIMAGQSADVTSIIKSKAGLKYTGPELDSIKAVTRAYQERSLHAFQDCLANYKSQLVDEPFMSAHLDSLYNNLLEQNLLKIIEPYSRVEVSHIARLINLPQSQVEKKLSHMILEKKLQGKIDQGTGCVEVPHEEKNFSLYPEALQIVTDMNRVVETLFSRLQKIAVCATRQRN